MYQSRDLERICRKTADLIEEDLMKIGLIFKVFSRVKSSRSIEKKIASRGAGYYDGENKYIRDIIGIRVILYFSDDIEIIRKSLINTFELIEKTVDENDETRFAPTRLNLIFRLSADYIQEFLDLTNDKIFDTTFEVQIRTIFSEGWHEIDHDLRYKCSSDWKKNIDLSRGLNGILASLETNEYAILRLFEQLSFRHYKEKNIPALLRTKFRLRFVNDQIDADLMDFINEEVIRDIFKLERIDVLNFFDQGSFLLPLTMDNFIFLINWNFLKNDAILIKTPKFVLDELNNL
ncbi:MAG: RelA/SpoT family protein [Saprospiraceae bacterium]|nr:RelA/SpoT family protein [Saprospiraceae bacterium]